MVSVHRFVLSVVTGSINGMILITKLQATAISIQMCKSKSSKVNHLFGQIGSDNTIDVTFAVHLMIDNKLSKIIKCAYF